MAFDSTEESTDQADTTPTGMAPASPMDTAEASEGEAPESTEENSEEATLSLDMLGGRQVKPGEKISLQVVSVSPDDGTVTVCAPKSEGGAISKAAAVFNEGK